MKTIHYHDQGEGFPIVWIHGFPLSSAIFEPQLTLDAFRHIRPDARGFGLTPPPSVPMTMSDYARDLVTVMNDAGIERAVIAGYSMGGYITMQLLRDAPERFAALLLLNTRETADTTEGKNIRRRQVEDVARDGTRSVIETMLPKMAMTDETRQAARRIMETATPEGVISALQAMASRQDSADTLRGVRVPTLVICGDHDEITPPSDSERMAALIPGAELAPIAMAAHMANFERPQQVNPLLAAFLDRHVTHANHAHSF